QLPKKHADIRGHCTDFRGDYGTTENEKMTEQPMLEGQTTGTIIRCFFRVYDYLGFGFLESVYCEALAIEFETEGLAFIREAPVAVWYRNGRRIGKYKVDFLVEGKIAVEVKATEILTYTDR